MKMVRKKMKSGCGKDKEMKTKDDVIFMCHGKLTVICHGRLTGDEEQDGKYM